MSNNEQNNTSELKDIPSYGIFPETAKEALERWDKGDSIFTVEMAGIGPGYEQAIQVLVMEIIREFLKRKMPLEPTTFHQMSEEIVHRIDEKWGGFSGVQVGAAMQLASLYIRDGYRVTIYNMAKHTEKENEPSRLIQISNFWPKV